MPTKFEFDFRRSPSRVAVHNVGTLPGFDHLVFSPGRNWRIGFDAGFNDRVQDAAKFFNGVCLKFSVKFYAGTIRPFGSRRKNKASDLWTSFRTERVLPWPMGSPLSCSIYETTREKYRMRTSTGPRATRSSTSC